VLLDHAVGFFATTMSGTPFMRFQMRRRRPARTTTFSPPLDAQNASHAAISSRRRSSASDLR
jgi:hypothetical protein